MKKIAFLKKLMKKIMTIQQKIHHNRKVMVDLY